MMGDDLQLSVRLDGASDPGKPLLVRRKGEDADLDGAPDDALVVHHGAQGWMVTDKASAEVVCLTDDDWCELHGWGLRLDRPSEPVRGYVEDDFGALSILEDSGFPIPWLTIEDAGEEGRATRRFELELRDGESVSVGRKVGDNGIRLRDRHVSREHLRLINRGEKIWVANLSQYPARVNGQDIPDEVALKHNDKIEVGTSTLRFHNPLEREGGAPVPRPAPSSPEPRPKVRPADATPTGGGGDTASVKIALIIAITLVVLLIIYLVVLLAKGGGS